MVEKDNKWYIKQVHRIFSMYENKCYRQQGEYYEVGGHEVVVVLSKGVRASPLNKESEKVRE